MRALRAFGLVFCYSVAVFVVHAQTGHTTPAEAKNHVGEKSTVCGTVVSTRFARQSRGQPTFLNLDKPYPNPIFTVVIWGTDREKFGDPETNFRDKQVCVTGKISIYRGVPEIAANEPTQIEIRK